MQKAQDYSIQKRKEKTTKIMIAKQRAKKKRKAENRKNAVCPKCSTQCTSSFQLQKHMTGHKCIKLQNVK